MCKENPCCGIATGVITSVILGIAVAVLFSMGVLVSITTALFVVLAFSGVLIITQLILATLLGAKPCLPFKRCLCCYGSGIIISALGTFILSIAALTILLDITSAPVIILIFAIATLLSFLIISIAQYILCIIDRTCQGCD